MNAAFTKSANVASHQRISIHHSDVAAVARRRPNLFPLQAADDENLGFSNDEGTSQQEEQQQQNRDEHRDAKANRRKRNKKASTVSATPQRREWLIQVTDQLVSSEPGSLTNGKWHEVTSILTAWSAFSKKDPEAPVRMEALLKRLWQEHAAGNSQAMPTIELYNTVLDAWACAALFKTQTQEQNQQHQNQQRQNQSQQNQSLNQQQNFCRASFRAREILVLLQETYEETKQTALQPGKF
jgi:hypothetical protein